MLAARWGLEAAAAEAIHSVNPRPVDLLLIVQLAIVACLSLSVDLSVLLSSLRSESGLRGMTKRVLPHAFAL